MFRPERWLEFGNGEAEREREKQMRTVVEEVFMSGKWTCPGREVARVELGKVFVEVSFVFSWGGGNGELGKGGKWKGKEES